LSKAFVAAKRKEWFEFVSAAANQWCMADVAVASSAIKAVESPRTGGLVVCSREFIYPLGESWAAKIAGRGIPKVCQECSFVEALVAEVRLASAGGEHLTLAPSPQSGEGKQP